MSDYEEMMGWYADMWEALKILAIGLAAVMAVLLAWALS